MEDKVAHFPKLKREDGLQKIEIELPPSSRFLTLVATDGGNGFSMDQIGFGDPDSEARPYQWKLTVDDRERLDRASPAATGDRRRSLSLSGRLQSSMASLLSPTVPEVRLLTRGDPESPIGDALTSRGTRIACDVESGIWGHSNRAKASGEPHWHAGSLIRTIR